MAEGSRRFLIQFIVDADDAVQNSTRLSGALSGVGAQMGQAAAKVQAAQPAVAGMNTSLQQTTTTVKSTQLATGQFSKGLGRMNKQGMSTVRRGFEMIRLFTGLGMVFRGLARGSPLQALMGIGMAMIRVERLFGRGKKQMQGVTHAQQKITKVSKMSLLTEKLRIKAQGLWNKGLLATKNFTNKNFPGMKAFALGMSKQTTAAQQFAGMLGARVKKAPTAEAADKMKASLTRFNKAGKIAQKGIGLFGKTVGVGAKALKFFVPGLGMMLKFILPLSLAIGGIVVLFLILKDVLKPIIGIIKMIASVFGVLIKVVALPLVMMFEQLYLVIAELMEPVMDLINALMPVAIMFGTVLMEPIKLLGKLLIPFMKDLFSMMGGMDALTDILVDVGVFMRELSDTLKEVVVVIFDELRSMMPEIVAGMKAFFKILLFVVKVLAVFTLGAIKLWLAWLRFTMPVRKFIFGIILKGFELISNFLTWLKEKFIALIEPVSKLATLIWDKLVSAFKSVRDSVKEVWDWLYGSGLFGIPEAAKVAQASLGGLSKSIGNMTGSTDKVWGELYGSGLFGIDVAADAAGDSIRIVHTALLLLISPLMIIASLFGAIGGFTVPAISAPGAMVAGAKTTLAGPGEIRSVSSPAVAPAQNAEPGARTVPHTSAQSSSASSAPIKITVPVTVQLDGFVLARAVSEYLIDIKRDRYQNEPLGPMRGVEPGMM